jgi:hypothetical protein
LRSDWIDDANGLKEIERSTLINGRFATQEISHSVWNPKAHYLEMMSFWDDTILSGRNLPTFGGTYCIHLQG